MTKRDLPPNHTSSSAGYWLNNPFCKFEVRSLKGRRIGIERKILRKKVTFWGLLCRHTQRARAQSCCQSVWPTPDAKSNTIGRIFPFVCLFVFLLLSFSPFFKYIYFLFASQRGGGLPSWNLADMSRSKDIP